MTDSDRHTNDPANPAQASEPVVSKPYIMPDDPEVGSAEALAKEAAEARDKMLRTLAEMENLRAHQTRGRGRARLRYYRFCPRHSRHRRQSAARARRRAGRIARHP